MKITIQTDEKNCGHNPISKPDKKNVFNSILEAVSFLTQQEYPWWSAVSTKKSGYLCDGEEFLRRHKNLIERAKKTIHNNSHIYYKVS